MLQKVGKNKYIFIMSDNKMFIDRNGFKPIAKLRNALPIAFEEYLACLAWISTKSSQQSINKRYDSYSLKHDVERFINDKKKEHVYISHGALTMSMISRGFSYKLRDRELPFYMFNIVK